MRSHLRGAYVPSPCSLSAARTGQSRGGRDNGASMSAQRRTISRTPKKYVRGRHGPAPDVADAYLVVRVDDEEAEPEVAGVDVAVRAEVGAPGLAALEEAVLVAGVALVRVRQVERGLDRVRLVARVDQADAHRVVGDEQGVLALAVEVVRVPGEEALKDATVGARALTVHGRRLHRMTVDAPEANLLRSTGTDTVTATRVEDVHIARAADADLVLEVDVIAGRRRR